MVENVWQVPADYNELHAKYGPFIAHIVTRYNKVGRNFRELFQHVWEKLVHVDVLTRFEEHVQASRPKTMLAVDACLFLGITFNQWRTAMWAFHNQGRKAAHWMPTPANEEEFLATSNGRNRGFTSKKAIFAFEDIAKIADHISGNAGSDEQAWFKSTGIVLPERKATRAHFQNYLSNMVRNTLANAFRTNFRKHKERAFDTFAQFRNPHDETHHGGYFPDPELLDEVASRRSETMTALAEAQRKIRAGLVDSIRDIPECKPVETYETELFERLEEGYTLTEAIRKLDVPNRYKERISRVVSKALNLS